MATAETDSAPALLFRVGTGLYGCVIERVREIVSIREGTRLPGAPPWVTGLVNLRGALVPVVALGRRFDPGYDVADDGAILLIESGGRVVGLAADVVLDVRNPALVAAPPAVAPALKGLVSGMGAVDERLVVLLDVPALVDEVLL